MGARKSQPYDHPVKGNHGVGTRRRRGERKPKNERAAGCDVPRRSSGQPQRVLQEEQWEQEQEKEQYTEQPQQQLQQSY